jgi:hypothetical protein
MKKSIFSTLLFVFVVSFCASEAAAQSNLIDARLEKIIIGRAENVSVILNSTGPVLIENDISKSSSQDNSGLGEHKVSMGKISREGFYAIRFSDSLRQININFVAIKTGANFELVDLKSVPKTGSTTAAQRDSATKAWGIIAARVSADLITTAFTKAFQKVFVNAAGTNGVKIVIVLTVATAASGGLVPVAAAVVLRGTLAKDLVEQFTLAFLDELVVAAGPRGKNLISQQMQDNAKILLEATGQTLNLKDFGDASKFDRILSVMQAVAGTGKVAANSAKGDMVADRIDGQLSTARFLLKLK